MSQTSAATAADFKTGMHAVITGSGSALIDPQRGGASAAVIVDGVVLQFDCGRNFMENLTRAGINPVDIDTLFLTHLHFDHIASFGYFIISSWIAGRQSTLGVLGPEGTARMAAGMIFAGHHTDVAFARSMVAAWPADVPGCPPAEPPFEAKEIGPGVVLERPGFKVTAETVLHGVPSLCFRVDSAYGSVVISGDCRPSPTLTRLARGADLLIHECARPDGGMLKTGKLNRGGFPDDAPAGGHTTPSWLGRLSRDAGAKRVIATHLAPFTTLPAAFEMSRLYYGEEQPPPSFWDDFAGRIKRDYPGDVMLAEDCMVVKVGT
jgi:ribonuclease Z